MANFINDLAKKISAVADETAKKAAEIKNNIVTAVNIKTEENKLSECYEKLGKALHEQCKGENRDREIADLIAEADGILSVLASLRREKAQETADEASEKNKEENATETSAEETADNDAPEAE